MQSNVTPQQKVYIIREERVEGFNSISSSINHLSINTPLEYKENSYYSIIPFNRTLVPSISDVKKRTRARGSRIPKTPMRNKYLHFLEIPKEIRVAFRFAANVDYEELYKVFSSRQLASFFSLFSALRIFENYITHKEIKTERGKFVTINSSFLRNVITNFDSDCAAAIDLAIYLGYIERNDSYSIGNYSKGYRLGQKFQNASWTVMNFLDCLERNIVGENWHSDSRLPQTTLWNKFNLHISKFLNTEDPVLKAIAERQYLLFKDLQMIDDGTFDETVLVAATKTVEKVKHEDSLLKVSKLDSDYSIESVMECYLNCRAIVNSGEVRILFHDKSYNNWTERMFHVITNMPSVLRKYLRYKGQSLVNIDIRACQVCLLAIFYDNGNELDRAEKEKFVSFITEKDFYTEISKNTTLDRPSAKDSTFKLMFAQNYCQNGAIHEEFKRLFPRLIDIIHNTKKNEGYKRVSQIMQRTESKIMIRGALNKLMIDSGLTVFSIHDSLLCLPEDTNEVKDAISNAFFAEMKFWPVLKVD